MSRIHFSLTGLLTAAAICSVQVVITEYPVSVAPQRIVVGPDGNK